jgi:hypothetical protein
MRRSIKETKPLQTISNFHATRIKNYHENDNRQMKNKKSNELSHRFHFIRDIERTWNELGSFSFTIRDTGNDVKAREKSFQMLHFKASDLLR